MLSNVRLLLPLFSSSIPYSISSPVTLEGFQSVAVVSVDSCSFLNVWPIHFYFLYLFIYFFIIFCSTLDIWLVVFHSSPFVIGVGHFIFIIFLGHVLIYTCRWFSALFVLFQVVHPYSSTAFTFLSERHNFVLKNYCIDFHIENTCMNDECAMLM
jgi:hypothetical protein